MIAYRITLPYACFWIETQNNVVVQAPPIAHWMVNRALKDICAFVARKRGTIEGIKNG